MSALLRTNNPLLVANAASALETIVSENDENKESFAERQGLHDLAYAAKRAIISTQRIMAGIFLELSIHPVVRNKMTTTTQLCKQRLKMEIFIHESYYISVIYYIFDSRSA